MGQAREGARDQVGVARIARFIVPFGAGGAADRAARAFAAAVAPEGAIAVENVPGEGGLAGVRRANAGIRSEREPVLLLGTPSTHVLLSARLGPDAAPDAALAPLMGLGSAPNVLLASARLGVSSVEELIARARTQRLAYASAGAGQTIHLCTAYFCALAGIRMSHRPYDAGSAHAYADLAAGRVHVYFDNLLACREAIARAEVVPLAVSSASRHDLLPDVPTLAQRGFPDHVLDIWFGVFAARRPAPEAPIEASPAARSRLAATLAQIGLRGGVWDSAELAERAAASRPSWMRALAAANAGMAADLPGAMLS
jgi:tripartite-type tricarboxylate transporter receptor subunit TctC